MQSDGMDTQWAEENLHVIRTLMERSALYRRRLAPLMTLASVGALAGGMAGAALGIQTARDFVFLWGTVAVTVLLGAAWIVRGQAIRAGESFWTPPAKRVLSALTPAMLVGGALGAAYIVGPESRSAASRWFLVITWSVLFGMGLHSAGFYVSQGIRRLGWAFVVAGLGLGWVVLNGGIDVERIKPSFGMMLVFGGLPLLSAVYLFFTESGEGAG